MERKEELKKKLGNILTRCQDQGRRRKNKKASPLDFWKNGGAGGRCGQHHSLHTMVSESQWVGLVWFSMGFKYLRFELEAGASHWHGQLIVVRAQKRGSCRSYGQLIVEASYKWWRRKIRTDFGEHYIICYILLTDLKRASIVFPVSYLVKASRLTCLGVMVLRKVSPSPAAGLWGPVNVHSPLTLHSNDFSFTSPGQGAPVSILLAPEPPAPGTMWVAHNHRKILLNEVSTLKKFMTGRNADLKRLTGSGERQCSNWLRLWTLE